MKKIFAISLLVMFLLAPGSAHAQEVPHIADTTIPVDADLKSAVDAWLSVSAPISIPNWVITYVGQTNEETGDTFVSLAALDIALPSETVWHITDDNIVKWFGSVIVHADDSIDVFSDGGYSQQANMGGSKLSSPKPDGGGSNVRFPWESGASMMYGTRGIHAAGGGAEYAVGFSAVDFLGGDDLGSGVASNKVYAVAEGEIDYVCTDANTTLIRTANTETDDYYIYAHLLDNSTLTEQYTYYQGDYIGSLKYGTFDDNCSWADQTAKHYHLHFGFKPANGFFIMEGCTLDMESGNWTCGSNTVRPGGYLRGGTGAPVIGDDKSASGQMFTFWDYALTGGVSMWKQFIVDHMPDHQANQFLYAMYNGVSVAIRISRVLVYSNINLNHFMAVFFFAMTIRFSMAILEFIVFLFKAWRSLVPIFG
jgi:hypothetical protein